MKILIVLLTMMNLQIAEAKNHGHKSHNAHVHGAGKLTLAFDDKIGKLEFESPAEAILGFEYQPKTEKDKKILLEATAKFTSEISKMVQLDSTLNCKFTNEEIGQFPEHGEKEIGKHSEWKSKHSISCEKSPAGTFLAIDFSGFKLIKNLDITVLIGDIQKSAKFKGKPVKIELK